MKIITFTFFAAIATILASSTLNRNKTKRSKNLNKFMGDNKPALRAACKKVCGTEKPVNYLTPAHDKASCFCYKGTALTHVYGFDKKANKFTASKIKPEAAAAFVKSGKLVAM